MTRLISQRLSLARRFRDVAIAGLAICVAVSLATCGHSSGKYKIGLLAPLTGAAASYGQDSRRGAQLALSDFTKTDPDLGVQLVIEDSRGDPATGLRAAAKLMELDKVVAVVGDVTSGVTLAVAPLANEREIPIISPGASSPKISEAGKYVFRTWPSDKYEAAKMAEHLTKLGVKRLAILLENNDYGQGVENAIKADLEKLGGSAKVVDVETFEQGTRNMRTQLLRIKESKADAIYFVGFPEAAVVFGRAYGQSGLKIPVFSTSAFEDPQVVRDVGKILDGTVYTKPLSESPEVASFQASYRALYSMAPGIVSGTTYDATTLVLKGIQNAVEKGKAVTGSAIRDYLLQVKNYPGASGTLSFEQDGDVVKPVGLFILKDGRYQRLGQ